MNGSYIIDELNCCITKLSAHDIIQIDFMEPLRPKYLMYNNLLIPILSINSKKFKTDINQILLTFRKIDETILVKKINIIDSFHPNAKQTIVPYLFSIIGNKVINEYCYENFKFNQKNSSTFKSALFSLISSLIVWNYDAAYWRDFTILNLDIDPNMIYIDPASDVSIKGKKLKRMIKKQQFAINFAKIINALFEFEKSNVEKYVMKFA